MNITTTGDPVCTCNQTFTGQNYKPYCPVHNPPTRWPSPLVGHRDKAQKCPVCEGEGKITRYQVDAEALKRLKPGLLAAVPEKSYLFECHGCDGKGWVTV